VGYASDSESPQASHQDLRKMQSVIVVRMNSFAPIAA